LGSIPPATQFSAARIPPSLASAEPTGTAAPEREQTAPPAAAHTRGNVGLEEEGTLAEMKRK
jgi:hypothetical protein